MNRDTFLQRRGKVAYCEREGWFAIQKRPPSCVEDLLVYFIYVCGLFSFCLAAYIMV